MSQRLKMSPSMAENVSEEGNNSERSSFLVYASKVFEESSVGPISNLAQASSVRQKALRAFFLVLCAVGFMYHSGKFLVAYFQYPVVVNIEIVRPLNFTLPAYTFCNNNGAKRSLFCEKYPESCEEPSEDFCKKYSSYCSGNETLVPRRQYSQKDNVTQEEIIQLNAKLEEFLIENEGKRQEEVTGPYFRHKDEEYPPLMLCYSWNERVNSSLNPLEVEKQNFFREPVNRFTFFIEEDEVFFPGERAGMLFAIHSPYEAVNPFETGIFLKSGRTYFIYVSLEEEVLLESPYETDCLNYTRLWESNNRSGPRSKNMCMSKCFQEITMACFHCVIPTFLYPTSEKLCRLDDLEKSYCPEQLIDQFAIDCFTNCKENCRQTRYTYNVQERFSVKFNKDGTILENIDQKVIVEIYLENQDIKVLNHSPKYMPVELFSNIGGFIGIWLGMSLLDFTDISGGVFRIIRHSVKRR